jgi:hypothetical protein
MSVLLNKVLCDIERERQIIAGQLEQIGENLIYADSLLSLISEHTDKEVSYDYKDGEKYLSLDGKTIFKKVHHYKESK